MSDVWKLVTQSQFEDACKLADIEYSSTGNIAPLRNKIHALLKLRSYDAAVQLCQSLIKIRNGETDSDFIYEGIAHWLKKDLQAGMACWQAAQKAKYTDAAGGIECRLLLWYGALRTDNRKLMQQTEKWLLRNYEKGRTVWPAPLAGFVCRVLQEKGLAAALSPNAILAERQWCQATFYYGLRALQDGHNSQFLNWMHKSASLPPFTWLEFEHYLALGEVEMHQATTKDGSVASS